LRAFLEGERELVAGHWSEAALAFRGAIAADSAFGLAHFRYALTQSWLEEPVEQAVLDALSRDRDKFPERERLLTDAFLTPGGQVTFRVERYREVTRRFPDYWPGWFLYADILSHDGTAAGVEWSEGLDAFHHALALNPDLVPAWEHLFFYALGRRPEEAARALARLRELGFPFLDIPLFRLQSVLLLGIGRAEGNIPPELDALADSVARLKVTWDNESGDRVLGPLLLLSFGFAAAQRGLNDRVLQTGKASRRLVTAIHVSNAWSWATQGRWDSALTTMRSVAETSPGPIGEDFGSRFPVGRPLIALESYHLAILGVWLGALAPELALERRPSAVAVIKQLGGKDRQDASGRLAWLDGLLGFARGDRAALRKARRDAMQSGYYQADLVDRSLAAFDHALSGDRKRAGRELADLEEFCLNDTECNSFTPNGGVQRLAAGEWLREEGESDRSRRMLQVWSGRGRPPRTGWWFTPYDAALSGPAYLARARLEESYGSPALAREYYQLALRVYNQPMPSQVHLVEEARAGLLRLGTDR
jgi:tetratricopeptide (TPR) repeat protein